jgi:hypothetical protein
MHLRDIASLGLPVCYLHEDRVLAPADGSLLDTLQAFSDALKSLVPFLDGGLQTMNTPYKRHEYLRTDSAPALASGISGGHHTSGAGPHQDAGRGKQPADLRLTGQLSGPCKIYQLCGPRFVESAVSRCPLGSGSVCLSEANASSVGASLSCSLERKLFKYLNFYIVAGKGSQHTLVAD